MQESASPRVVQSTSDPYIKSVNFHLARPGAMQFDVSLVADSNYVQNIVLFLVPNQVRSYVVRPVTGNYAMIDTAFVDNNAYYYFQFAMRNGTVIKLAKFRVKG